jgi:hypothetical protein
VTDKMGRPIAGVPVQVFNFDSRRHEFETSKFSETITSRDGSYDLDGLPAQQYIVAVNGEKSKDGLDYPPTFYQGASRRELAQRISLGDAEFFASLALEG